MFFFSIVSFIWSVHYWRFYYTLKLLGKMPQNVKQFLHGSVYSLFESQVFLCCCAGREVGGKVIISIANALNSKRKVIVSIANALNSKRKVIVSIANALNSKRKVIVSIANASKSVIVSS